jgi:hypothetical protein
MGVALVRFDCFRNRILYISTSNVLTTKVIIYFINVIDSLGNYIYIFINYNPLLRILGGEIHRRRTYINFTFECLTKTNRLPISNFL